MHSSAIGILLDYIVPFKIEDVHGILLDYIVPFKIEDVHGLLTAMHRDVHACEGL